MTNNIHCLKRDEYKQVILKRILNLTSNFELPLVDLILERAEVYWDMEMIGINYFLLKIIEQFEKLNSNTVSSESILAALYKMQDTQELFFTIQEFDLDYITFLMKNCIPSLGPLEDDLVDAQHRLKQ